MAFEFTDANVKEIIASGEPVVVDFWATWCGPCMRLAPVIDELSSEYEGRVKIGKYNIEEENELSTEYRIMSIPTILFSKRRAGSRFAFGRLADKSYSSSQY